jgi:cytochrome c
VKRLKVSLLCAAVILASSLATARIHPFGDAGLYSAAGAQTRGLNNMMVSPDVRAILVEKCADCHSNQPRVPFYGRLAPISWLMEHDIVQARNAMNLSRWESYSAEQQQTLVAKMVQEAKSQRMPPVQYRLIHWNARVNGADMAALTHWAHTISGDELGAEKQVSGAGDAARGKALFEKRCTGCHALTVNREGPMLTGVYGRVSGTAPGFAYSTALKNAHVVWNEKSLDQWLTDPDAFLPGNDMDFLVSKPQERSDLISYLRQISGK